MTLNIIPGLGTIIWLVLWAGVAALLVRQKFPLWEAVLLAFITELGVVVFVAEGVYSLTQGRTFFGDERTPAKVTLP